MTVMPVHKPIDDFVEELKKRDDVLGVILFGSWARGNNRPDSDVDLLVILSEGFQRAIEERDKQVFEIIYTTSEAALDYYKDNKDQAYELWKVAKVLYDRDGTVQNLKSEVDELLGPGKKIIDNQQIRQLRFDAEDQIKYVEFVLAKDPTTANLILANKVFGLTEVFFDLRQIWTPAPKQRLEEIKKMEPEFYSLLVLFNQEHKLTKEKIEIAKKIICRVFEVKG